MYVYWIQPSDFPRHDINSRVLIQLTQVDKIQQKNCILHSSDFKGVLNLMPQIKC